MSEECFVDGDPRSDKETAWLRCVSSPTAGSLLACEYGQRNKHLMPTQATTYTRLALFRGSRALPQRSARARSRRGKRVPCIAMGLVHAAHGPATVVWEDWYEYELHHCTIYSYMYVCIKGALTRVSCRQHIGRPGFCKLHGGGCCRDDDDDDDDKAGRTRRRSDMTFRAFRAAKGGHLLFERGKRARQPAQARYILCFAFYYACRTRPIAQPRPQARAASHCAGLQCVSKQWWPVCSPAFSPADG